ncbi:hypothetical protein M569_07930 [Genlisea aurea]|uniref:Uncharacterized protein n=1 Tax=Genlisea aurea TaxID=192259 RepID=S8CPW7_9LAMI|nr:hypothetical protein M569_07930 [Genlisea aurea]
MVAAVRDGTSEKTPEKAERTETTTEEKKSENVTVAATVTEQKPDEEREEEQEASIEETPLTTPVQEPAAKTSFESAQVNPDLSFSTNQDDAGKPEPENAAERGKETSVGIDETHIAAGSATELPKEEKDAVLEKVRAVVDLTRVVGAGEEEERSPELMETEEEEEGVEVRAADVAAEGGSKEPKEVSSEMWSGDDSEGSDYARDEQKGQPEETTDQEEGSTALVQETEVIKDSGPSLDLNRKVAGTEEEGKDSPIKEAKVPMVKKKRVKMLASGPGPRNTKRPRTEATTPSQQGTPARTNIERSEGSSAFRIPKGKEVQSRVQKETSTESTYYIDWEALEELKIRKRVERMLRKSGLLKLLDATGDIDGRSVDQVFTHKTLKVESFNDIDTPCLQFVLDRQQHIVTIRELARMCKLLPDSIIDSAKFDEYIIGEPKNFNVDAVYKRLTGKNFDKMKSSGRDILNPALRYIQFLLGYNLSSRGKNYTNVTRHELWILDSLEKGLKINPAALAMYTIASWRQKASTPMRKLGHLVTTLARGENVKLDESKIRKPMPLTLKALEKHNLVKKDTYGRYTVLRRLDELQEEEGESKESEEKGEKEEDAQRTSGLEHVSCGKGHRKKCIHCRFDDLEETQEILRALVESLMKLLKERMKEHTDGTTEGTSPEAEGRKCVGPALLYTYDGLECQLDPDPSQHVMGKT